MDENEAKRHDSAETDDISRCQGHMRIAPSGGPRGQWSVELYWPFKEKRREDLVDPYRKKKEAWGSNGSNIYYTALNLRHLTSKFWVEKITYKLWLKNTKMYVNADAFSYSSFQNSSSKTSSALWDKWRGHNMPPHNDLTYSKKARVILDVVLIFNIII